MDKARTTWSTQKNLLKRSPEREKAASKDKSPTKKKKRCIKPVWSTSKKGANEDHSDSTDDDIVGVQMVEIKAENASEGNLVPYMIRPMADPPKKKKKSSSKKHTAARDTREVREVREVRATSPPREVREVRPTSPPREVRDVRDDSPEQTLVKAALDIPVLGLSTFRICNTRLVNQAVNAALDHGYRLFDTGAHYRNERELGNAFKEYLPQHRLKREDIYIISKLDPGCMSYDDAMESAEQSLSHLKTDYLDIILLHWPEPHYSMGIEPGNAMLECYRALEDLHSAGKIKDIGVYKFSTEQLEYLLRRCVVVPAMLQAEFHPYYYRKSLVDICRFNSIRMQAFCFIKCVEDPAIVTLSRKYRKAPAQIILRWIIQHGVGVLPKSKTPSHIQENANIFDFSLSPDDIEWINSLNKDRSFTPYSNPYFK